MQVVVQMHVLMSMLRFGLSRGGKQRIATNSVHQAQSACQATMETTIPHHNWIPMFWMPSNLATVGHRHMSAKCLEPDRWRHDGSSSTMPRISNTKAYISGLRAFMASPCTETGTVQLESPTQCLLK